VSERGSVSPIALGVIVFLLMTSIGIVDVGLLLAGRLRVTAAADAAALAAAPVTFRPFGARAGPREEARRFATANGARLVSCDCARNPSWEPRTVRVVVERRVELLLGPTVVIRAAARSRFEPLALLGGR